jgi:hypothetical protein
MPKEYQTATFSPDTMNNVDDPYEVGQHFMNGAYDQAVYMANIDPGTVKRLRVGQQTVLAASGLDSGWSDPYEYNLTDAYFTNGPLLNHIDQYGTITVVKYNLIPGLKVRFVQCNDVVVYSNGIQFGVIENLQDTPPFYPSPTVQNQLGSYIPSYKERMVAGKLMEFYNGRLYALVDNYLGKPCALVCSDSLDTPGWLESMDTRQNIVAEFDGEGTMLARVDDGLFVGTTLETFFLLGKDAVVDGGFEVQRSVAPYGVVIGTQYPVKGERTILKKPGNFQQWTSARGVCIGGNAGFFINETQDTVSFPPGQIGTAIVREQDGEVHYICSMQQPGVPYNKYQRSL